MAITDLDPNVFIENTNRELPDAIKKYPWQHVAWSLDGNEILAHSSSLKDLYTTVDQLGISDFVVDYLMPEDGSEPDCETNTTLSATAAEIMTEAGA